MKYPFYTWLSIFGVMIEFGKAAIRVLFVERPFSPKRWILFVPHFFLVIIGFIMLPVGLMLIPFDAISQYNAILGAVWNVAMLVVFYVMGVLGARYLYRWSKKQEDSPID